MKNPFAGFGKVILGDRLVGREEEIRNLTRGLAENNGSVAVIGTPRIGKTSLVQEVCRRLSASTEPRVARFEIDLSTIPDSVELFLRINENLLSFASQNAPHRICVSA